MIDIFLKVNSISALLFISIVSILGILIGKIKIGPLKLGVSGVLFTGILAGHFGAKIDPETILFTKQFGLILFVYAIGINIGPRFLSSFRDNGLILNGMAFLIVFTGLICAIAVKLTFDLDIATVAGLYSGGVTNTPSLGAVQSILLEQFSNGNQLGQKSGMAYAIAYPFGIIGTIFAMLLIKKIHKIDLIKETNQYREQQNATSGTETIKVNVTNPNVIGLSLLKIKEKLNFNFVISRILRKSDYSIPEENTIIKKGDTLIGLCKKDDIEAISITFGTVDVQEKFEIKGKLSMQHIRVTNKKISGKRLKDIKLPSLFPANITRVFRGETEIIPSDYTTLEFGDTVRVVGRTSRMESVAKFLGNSLKNLTSPNLIPLFIGIFTGVLLGNIPIFIPGLPTPTKLGLAGGPLIISLFLGHKGRIGKLDFYMTPSVNRFIRELGMILFLGCVGIGSGEFFLETLLNGGYLWMAYASIITFIPIVLIGIVGRILNINFLTICGYISGAMTSSPTLEFSNEMSHSQAQATAFATVYPVTMFLRILSAQILVFLFA